MLHDLNRHGRLYKSNELPNDGWLSLNWDFEQAYRFLRAMDYQGLNILPRPEVELQGDVRRVESYSIETNKAAQAENELHIPSGDQNKILCCRLEA